MRYRLLPVLLLALCCLGMGKKKLDLSVRFYTQAAKIDSESFAVPVTLLNGTQTYVDVRRLQPNAVAVLLLQLLLSAAAEHRVSFEQLLHIVGGDAVGDGDDAV